MEPKSPSTKQSLRVRASESCPPNAEVDSTVSPARTPASSPEPGACEITTSTEQEQATVKFSNSSWEGTLAADQNTYFVDTRDPEPEEMTFLLDDPFPPSSMLLSTTESLGSESAMWLAGNVPPYDSTASGDIRATSKNPPTLCWRPAYSFVKLHYLQGILPDDALGSVFFNHRASSVAEQGTTASSPDSDYSGTVACRPSLRNPQSLPDFAVKYHASGSLVCLADGLRSANQLTWFRFRTLLPCALTALTYRLCITEDNVIQGRAATFDPAIGRRGSTTRSCRQLDKFICDHDKCLLTPLASIPNYEVTSYFGNISFFFVRETTDLRELLSSPGNVVVMVPFGPISCVQITFFLLIKYLLGLRFQMGGLRCFVHASVADAQSVISAHTISFGGNALLSYHISELLIIRPPSRNQAQCILNLCGDMAYVTPVV
ncbi:unnamed protein product [Dibothriocephalus latus]|uniref:C2CD5 C-terminal domain-containing protein n=1 Tax=Dibothriocephalus latus TaxID=60516 RepID=A0A3P6SLW2_DIBLA|nr:unnamed protein product [Dibothriocephalus latus]